MPKEYARHIRVADLIQRELAVVIERERTTQSGTLITISNVDVSPDLKNATVFITLLGDEDEKNAVNDLQDNAGHFRHHLSKQLDLRVVPKLNFRYDHALAQANRLTSIIDSLSDDSSNQK